MSTLYLSFLFHFECLQKSTEV